MNLKFLNKIDSFSEAFKALSDEELLKASLELKEQKLKKVTNRNILKVMPEAFALVKEAMTRALKMSPFDAQYFSAIELFNNNIVEFHPGEGKSFAIVLAIFLKHLTGKKIHVMVENDFLLQRDFHKARSIFKYLGLTVGAIVSKKASEYEEINKKEAYECDVTYVHPIEVSFDYLKAQDKSYIHEALLIVDDIDRVIATTEPSSVVLIDEKTSDMENLLLVDFVKKYTSLTGIADFALKEKKIYKSYLKKNVVLVKDSFKSQRVELPDNISITKEQKYDRILDEVLEIHKYRCPVIIVIPEEKELEMMTSRLEKKGFIFKLANKKNDLRSFYNISQAGRLNFVTVISQTSGVDIPLGGDPYYLALDELDRIGLEPDSPEWKNEWRNAYEFMMRTTISEENAARDLGGVYEIIAEHTDKDDVFMSYCARRGEKGFVKFFISLEDGFFKDINMDKFFAIINALNLNREKVLNNKTVSNLIVKIVKFLNNSRDRLVR